MEVKWLKRLVAGKELDTLERYRDAVQEQLSGSHDAQLVAWAIWAKAEGGEQPEMDRRSHPFK